MSEQFFTEVAEVFEISSKDLHDEAVFLEKAPWDSLRVLSVISIVDEFYSVALSTSEIMKCKNVDDIMNVVRNRGGIV